MRQALARVDRAVLQAPARRARTLPAQVRATPPQPAASVGMACRAMGRTAWRPVGLAASRARWRLRTRLLAMQRRAAVPLAARAGGARVCPARRAAWAARQPARRLQPPAARLAQRRMIKSLAAGAAQGH